MGLLAGMGGGLCGGGTSPFLNIVYDCLLPSACKSCRSRSLAQRVPSDQLPGHEKGCLAPQVKRLC